jgi:UDP:flavonoid glycosyltransferase YjiC (YdhE family)
MVADQLRKSSIDVRFSSFGEAASYVSLHGYECTTVAPVEFVWNMEGGFSVKDSLANLPVWFANFSRQVNQETRNLTEHRPDVVVTDTRLSPVVAAKLLRIPSIVILNQVKLLLSPRLQELFISRLFEDMVGEFMGSAWALADRVLIPDLPPPFTISAHNTWQVGSAAGKLEYIGFTSPKHLLNNDDIDEVARELSIDRSRPLVFVHVSGPSETRMPLIKLALEVVSMFGSAAQFVISEGKTDGDTKPRRIGDFSWYYEWCPVRDEIFAMSDALVLRGGHVALSQAVQFGKPVVTVPIENHGEQLGNSARIQNLGMGIMLHPNDLRPEQLAKAVSQVLENLEYKNKAKELQSMAEKIDGIDNVVRMIKSYL